MSFQPPDLNRVMGGLTSFPPKLSSLIEPLATFEQQASAGLPLPRPGPATLLEQTAQQFESSMGSASFALPALPQLPFAQPTQASQTSQTVTQPMVPASPLAQAPAAVQPIMPTGSKFQVL
jgi:hypothetical protein